MQTRPRVSLMLVAVCLALVARAARADDEIEIPPLVIKNSELEPAEEQEQPATGEPCLACLAWGHRRAGCPLRVARWAQPSYTPRETGYYVGGGAAFRGEPRCLNEGTWGWDYVGVIPKRVALKWWHGRRYQGGFGSYRTDGPHLVHH